MDLPAGLVALLGLQCGLASRAQLLDAGVSTAAVRWRTAHTWRLVLPGVVATFTGRLDPRQRLIAAQLFGGPDAVLGSWTAAAWHGVGSAQNPQVRLIVPVARSSRQAGFVRVTRTTRPEIDSWSRPPLRISSRGRSIVDAARDVTSQRLATELVIEAVQRRLVTLEMLRHELECGARHGSRQVRVALAAAERNVWSVPELDLAELVSHSTVLPESWPNPALRTASGLHLPTPDLWFDDVGLAVQLHSRTYHQRDDDWDATVMADSALGEEGILVLGVTPSRLGRRPNEVLVRIERSYVSLRGRPRPDVLASPGAGP